MKMEENDCDYFHLKKKMLSREPDEVGLEEEVTKSDELQRIMVKK
jgi:hypothetical protein